MSTPDERTGRKHVPLSALDELLDDAAVAVDCLSAIVQVCSEATGKAVTLFDRQGHVVASSRPDAGRQTTFPPLREIVRGHTTTPTSADPVVLPAELGTGLSRRKILSAIVERGEHLGWLVVDEQPTPFHPPDEYVTLRCARRIGAQFLTQRRITRVAWNARSALARQLVRGSGAWADLAAGAEYLGVNVHARRSLVYIRESDGTPEDLDRSLAEHTERALGVEVLSTRGSEGILLLIEAPEHVASPTVVARITATLEIAATELSPTGGLIAGVSSVYEPESFARAYREAREVVRCIDRFTHGTGNRVLAVDDLGPSRLFLANGEVSAIRHFIDDMLGPLLDDDAASTELVRTLAVWFEQNRGMRRTATRLGVHENTVRLRLSRVHALTGLDVTGDASHQLSIHAALLVLRLRDHPAFHIESRCAETDEPKRIGTLPDERRSA
ncbi:MULTISPECIES: PucR family transcriptional regulator [unclassified Rhodococcus (in: high G+C Gram-positive bacteria)]|jgi:sugar diacid utilization regulator|uniref:PucR family transcriptional regulator n=1 Tax=unclassified Rhodococcus (in: high G+C Gram-positive bacteria) TaxID=192944 RepID=UPI00035C193A|nr:helix-turn-helix domain-containing protein [Rhodococcus sp. DK17]